LRAWAEGLLCLEAAVELLIGQRLLLFRGDFLGVAVEPGWQVFGGQALAAVDFEAAATALEAGELPCSSGEGRVLRLAASFAAGVLVDLREVLTGLDEASSGLAAAAVLHATGHQNLSGWPAFGGERR
jgi:hypothetical protein